jgi:hypothetical protein
MAHEQPQTKISTKERLQNAVDFILQHDVVIMETASIPASIWDEIMVEGMLGSFHPTLVLAKALIANLQTHSDTFLVETILEYLRSGNGPKRCKAQHVKEWYTIMCELLRESSAPHSPIGDGNMLISSGPTPFMEKVKIEIKLDLYNGTIDECAEFCHRNVFHNKTY